MEETIKTKHKSKKNSKSKKKKRKIETDSSSSESSTDSDIDTSSDSSSEGHTKKRKKKSIKHKHKKSRSESSHKLHKKKQKHKKKKSKRKKHSKHDSLKKLEEDSENDIGPLPIDADKSMVPMAKEEWEKQQSIIRRVYDPETGRNRLIKGDGEVLEEIVSKERHKEINKIATYNDGQYFKEKLGLQNQP